ncbi:hypothetical protein BD413DRAFT_491488 [Trametes elegans]|nr:hypothetical protein BD413DRAFT_491488 [Trametes elegans]
MPPRASLCTIPAEIQDLILDHLRGDAKTLVACCRTTRNWLPRARYNLYFAVVLNVHNVESFFATVSQDHVTASFIRSLFVQGPRVWLMKTPAAIKVTNLRIIYLDILRIPPRSLDPVFSGAADSLTELRLWRCEVLHLDVFLQSLQCASKLKHLCIGESLLHVPQEGMLDLVGFSALQTLVLIQASKVLDRLSRIPNGLPSLIILKLTLHQPEVPAFNSFLLTFGGQLKELCIKMLPLGRNFDPSTTVVSLHPCTQLLVLNFALWLRPFGTGQGNHLSWVVPALSSARAQGLRKLDIALALHKDKTDLDFLDFAGISRVLSEPRFQSLRVMVVRVARGRRAKIDAVPLIRELLAAVDKQGILRCFHSK